MAARVAAAAAWRLAGSAALLEGGAASEEYVAHKEAFVQRHSERFLAQWYRGNDEEPLAEITRSHAVQFVGRRRMCADDPALPGALQQELQMSRARRSPARPQQLLCGAMQELGSGGWHWPCELPSGGDSAGNADQPRLLRLACDSFASPPQCRDLCGFALRAMEGLASEQGQTSVPLGPHLDPEALAMVGQLLSHVQVLVRAEAGLDSSAAAPYFAGGTLSRILPAAAAPRPAAGTGCGDLCQGDDSENDEGPFCPHVDRARVPSDDYSAVLYLGTQGEHFEGGGFVFVDQEVDMRVEPRQGRLLLFSSGPENMHRVDRVTKGARFTLAMWFTLSPGCAAVWPPGGQAAVRLAAAAGTLPRWRVASLEYEPVD